MDDSADSYIRVSHGENIHRPAPPHGIGEIQWSRRKRIRLYVNQRMVDSADSYIRVSHGENIHRPAHTPRDRRNPMQSAKSHGAGEIGFAST